MSTDALREAAVEELAAKLHAIYQQEAERQGDKRHPDSYVMLPERIKEFDRVLARYILQREVASVPEKLPAKWPGREAARKLLAECKGMLYLAKTEMQAVAGNTNVACLEMRISELEAALKADRQGITK
jgi:hypothetical protein